MLRFSFAWKFHPLPLIILLMNQIRNLIFILCCFLFLVTNISFGAEEPGIRRAQVNVPEAVIYSDPATREPIGKVSKGTLISVGRPLTKNPSVAPVIVSGRIAYMQLSDLFLDQENKIIVHEKNSKTVYHDPNLLFPPPPENLLENNAAYITIHQLNTGPQMRDVFKNIDGVDLPYATGIGMIFLHRQSSANYLWGLGFEYYFQSSKNVDFDFFILNPTLGYTPIKNPLFALDLLFSLDFSLGTTLDIKNNYHNEDISTLIGPDVGARLVLFPNSKYHLTTTVSYRKYFVMGTSSYYDAQEVAYPPIKRIGGTDISVGFAFDI